MSNAASSILWRRASGDAPAEGVGHFPPSKAPIARRVAKQPNRLLSSLLLLGSLVGACLAIPAATAQTSLPPGVSSTVNDSSNTSADPAFATLRARLPQRLSGFPPVDDVRPSGMPGLFEVCAGQEFYYTDAQGNFLLRGELFDTQSQRNLTRERLDKLNEIDFSKLPLQDAIVWKSGNGQRRIAVFSDPNCPYCKKLETEQQGLKDVTVYTFLFPILAPDSSAKAQAIWCSKDTTQVWRDWMLKATPPPASPSATIATTACANPIERNLALGKAHRVNGVPAVVFEDGSRSPGLISAAQIEDRVERKREL